MRRQAGVIFISLVLLFPCLCAADQFTPTDEEIADEVQQKVDKIVQEDYKDEGRPITAMRIKEIQQSCLESIRRKYRLQNMFDYYGPLLEGRTIQVRVFRDFNNVPDTYELIPMTVRKKPYVRFGLEESLNPGDVVMFCSADQSDETLRQLIGNYYVYRRFTGKGSVSLIHSNTLKPVPIMTFHDALDRPIVGATVFFHARVDGFNEKLTFHEEQTDADGSVPLPRLSDDRIHLRIPNYTFSHPDYGVVCSHGARSGPYAKILKLPLVRSNEDPSVIIRNTVVNEENHIMDDFEVLTWQDWQYKQDYLDAIADAKIVIRIFRQDMEDGEYDSHEIDASQGELELGSLRKDYGDTVVICGQDQTYPQLKSLFDHVIFLGSCMYPYRFSLDGIRGVGKEAEYWTIVDANSDPIPNADVTLMLCFRTFGKRNETEIGTTRTDENGRILPPIVDNHTNIHQDHINIECIVSHPEYGIGCAIKPFRYTDQIFYSCLVPDHTKLATRALRGIVVNENNAPIPFTKISCKTIYTLGGIYSYGMTASQLDSFVYTDNQGRFRYYLPLTPVMKDRIGLVIPDNTKYHAWICAPRETERFFFYGELSNNTEHQILLEKGYLHSFVFEDANGAIIEDNDEIPPLYINRTEPVLYGPKQTWGIDTSKPIYLPLGLYTFDGFDSIEVVEDSPVELVFRRKPQKQYVFSGRVVDALTGEATEGIYVLFNADRENFCTLTDEDWEQMHQVWEGYTPDNLQLEPLIKLIYTDTPFTRTDANGSYQFTIDRLKYNFVQFTAIEQNTMTTEQQMDISEEIAKSQYEFIVPDLKLFPAAKGKFHTLYPGTNTSASIKFVIDPCDSRPWVKDFRKEIGQDDWNRTIYSDEWTINYPQTIFIPAGVKFKFWINPDLESLQSIKISQDYYFEQGEFYDFGQFELQKTITVFVLITDQQDKALASIPVSAYMEDSDVYTRSSLTDENGYALLQVYPNSKGTFRVDAGYVESAYLHVFFNWETLKVDGWLERDYKHLNVEIPFELTGPQDENKIFEMTLPDEVIKHLSHQKQ